MSEEDDDIDKNKDNPYFIAKAVFQTFRGTDWTKYMVSYGLKFLKFWESPYGNIPLVFKNTNIYKKSN